MTKFPTRPVSRKPCSGNQVVKHNLLSLIIFLFLLICSSISATGQAIHSYSYGFVPSNMGLNKGDTIEWINSDSHDHSFTSDLPTSSPDYWSFSAHAGEAPYYLTFNHAGTFTFHDKFSAYTGTITVFGEPIVAITYPTNGAGFLAPASFNFSATASNASYVKFYVDGNFLKRIDSIPPYPVSVTNLPAGTHQLTAVATDGYGYNATNSISVTVNALVIKLLTLEILNGQFLFDATGLTPGSTNIVQSSTDLVNWVSLQTNVASADPQTFTNQPVFERTYYRVVQLP